MREAEGGVVVWMKAVRAESEGEGVVVTEGDIVGE